MKTFKIIIGATIVMSIFSCEKEELSSSEELPNLIDASSIQSAIKEEGIIEGYLPEPVAAEELIEEDYSLGTANELTEEGVIGDLPAPVPVKVTPIEEAEDECVEGEKCVIPPVSKRPGVGDQSDEFEDREDEDEE